MNWQESLHPQTIDLGLERVTEVFSRLIPQCSNVARITVAGTNGKGSTIALLEAIYRAQGYRVGAYTSPNILKYNERISINGQPVEDELICAAFERIESCRQDISLSYFEFGTLAALDIFERAQLDIQLLEVGLGGRLDAVNIVDPTVAMISSIDIDHAEWLGNTREAIAREKAGIFRAHIPAIIGDPDPPETLAQSGKACQAKLFYIGQDFNYKQYSESWDWCFGDLTYNQLPLPGLKGSHQFRNASAVLAAITQLQKRLPVSDTAIRVGLSQVNLKGRFQLIPGDVSVLLDVGHNPQAVRTLFEYVSQTYPDKRIHALFAIMKDKDIKAVIEIMKPLIYSWVLAPLDNPRAATSEILQQHFKACGINDFSGNFKDFITAVNEVETKADSGDLILVFGSFFLVSAYLAKLANDSNCSAQLDNVDTLQHSNSAEFNTIKPQQTMIEGVI